MKRVLIITYHFPPEGGPAVQRILKFVKYLPRYGYVPIVLSARHPLKTIDPTLVDDVPSQTSTFQTKDWGSYIPHDIRKFMKRLFLPDNQAVWKYTAIKKSVDIIKNENIQLIYSSSPPHSVHLIAKEIAQKTGIPWAADFRDEWTFDPMFKNSSFKDSHTHMEQEVLQKCAAITTIQNNARDNFSQIIDKNKIFVIRNGYDPDDFTALDSGVERHAEKLTITYSGRFTMKSSPDTFFHVLDSMCKKDITLKQNITLCIIGKSGNKKWIEKYPILREMARFIPYQPHKQCMSLLNQSDVLLLLANNLKSSEVLPAKMYEYFYLKKPIFAVVSYPGELTSLLKDYGNAYIGYESDTKTIEDNLYILFSDWQQNTMSKPVSNDFVSQFDRSLQTQQLSELFNTLTESKN